NTVYRGFLSSVENIVHFGLGEAPVVDSVVIRWSDGNVQKLAKPEINKTLIVQYTPAAPGVLTSSVKKESVALFQKHAGNLGINFRHEEDDKIDFNVQRTLPHKFTQSGPGLAVGDINGDGLEDFIVGGSTGYWFSAFVQNGDGTFRNERKVARDVNKPEEDEGLLLFDADGDQDLDLYVVSGSMEHFQTKDPYQDRLYRNDGKGRFTPDDKALPDTKASGSCVRAADFDADGDLDLFVGGRLVPGQYPLSPDSYLLMNDAGKFRDVTGERAPELRKAGMITDAIWTDFNSDGKTDLIAVGEFTPVMFFENSGSKLTRIKTEIDQKTGWWNSITPGDFDLDGDIDYVVGNLGLNNCYQASQEYPLKVYAKDYDGNMSMDAVMACYIRATMDSYDRKLYPVHFWDELNTQSPKFRNKFSYYRQYGKATISDLLSPEDLKDALVLEANEMASVYVENLGQHKFGMRELAPVVQVAPVNGMVTEDVNGDGNPDVVMVGNDYGNEVFAGRYDAFNGLVLAGDGKGNFKPETSAQTGFYVPGDAKALVRVHRQTGDLLISSQNRDSLKVFVQGVSTSKTFIPEPLDVKAELTFTDGRKQIVEFAHGSGYLSQSSRTMVMPKGVREMTVFNSHGQSRKVLNN
ncbi:MAG TPA: FG-GAP-like repeat-containing protein, partial [Chryseosolibacter sp.]